MTWDPSLAFAEIQSSREIARKGQRDMDIQLKICALKVLETKMHTLEKVSCPNGQHVH